MLPQVQRGPAVGVLGQLPIGSLLAKGYGQSCRIQRIDSEVFGDDGTALATNLSGFVCAHQGGVDPSPDALRAAAAAVSDQLRGLGRDGLAALPAPPAVFTVLGGELHVEALALAASDCDSIAEGSLQLGLTLKDRPVAASPSRRQLVPVPQSSGRRLRISLDRRPAWLRAPEGAASVLELGQTVTWKLQLRREYLVEALLSKWPLELTIGLYRAASAGARVGVLRVPLLGWAKALCHRPAKVAREEAGRTFRVQSAALPESVLGPGWGKVALPAGLAQLTGLPAMKSVHYVAYVHMVDGDTAPGQAPPSSSSSPPPTPPSELDVGSYLELEDLEEAPDEVEEPEEPAAPSSPPAPAAVPSMPELAAPTAPAHAEAPAPLAPAPAPQLPAASPATVLAPALPRVPAPLAPVLAPVKTKAVSPSAQAQALARVPVPTPVPVSPALPAPTKAPSARALTRPWEEPNWQAEVVRALSDVEPGTTRRVVQPLNIATYNVRGVRDPAKLKDVLLSLSDGSLTDKGWATPLPGPDVICLQEVQDRDGPAASGTESFLAMMEARDYDYVWEGTFVILWNTRTVERVAEPTAGSHSPDYVWSHDDGLRLAWGRSDELRPGYMRDRDMMLNAARYQDRDTFFRHPPITVVLRRRLTQTPYVITTAQMPSEDSEYGRAQLQRNVEWLLGVESYARVMDHMVTRRGANRALSQAAGEWGGLGTNRVAHIVAGAFNTQLYPVPSPSEPGQQQAALSFPCLAKWAAIQGSRSNLAETTSMHDHSDVVYVLHQPARRLGLTMNGLAILPLRRVGSGKLEGGSNHRPMFVSLTEGKQEGEEVPTLQAAVSAAVSAKMREAIGKMRAALKGAMNEGTADVGSLMAVLEEAAERLGQIPRAVAPL